RAGPGDLVRAARDRRNASAAARGRPAHPNPLWHLARYVRWSGAPCVHPGSVLLDEVPGRIGPARPDGRGERYYDRSDLLPLEQPLPAGQLARDQGAFGQPLSTAWHRCGRDPAAALHLRAAAATVVRQ